MKVATILCSLVFAGIAFGDPKKVEVYSVSRDLVDIASSQVIGVDARDQERVSFVIYRKGELVQDDLAINRKDLADREKLNEDLDPLFGSSDTVLVVWSDDKDNPLLVRIEYGRPRLQVLHCSKVADGCFVARRYAQTLIDEKLWEVLWGAVNSRAKPSDESVPEEKRAPSE